MSFHGPDAPQTPIPNADPQLPQVTFVPEVHLIRVSGLSPDQGGPEGDVIYDSPGSELEEIAERFVHMQAMLGPGTHDAREVRSQLGFNPAIMATTAQRLADLLPPVLFGYEREGDERRIMLGRMAVAIVEATDAEREAFVIRAESAREANHQLRKAELLAHNAEKINLTEYDHAIVSHDDNRYYFELGDRDMILSVRAIEALAALQKDYSRVNLIQLGNTVWGNMPIAERLLFSDNERQIYGYGAALLKQGLSDIAEGLTGRMKVTRRGSASGSYLITPAELSIAFSDRPLDQAEHPGLIRAFPEASSLAVQSLDEAQLQRAEELLALALQGGRRRASMGQGDALELLDEITSPGIKRALQLATSRSGDTMSLHDVLRTLHGVARGGLGDTEYFLAWRERMIGGGTWRRGVRQTGGELRASTTNRSIRGEGSLRRWTFYPGRASGQ